MSVEFFPDRDISRLEEVILNQDGNPNWGEIAVYKILQRDLSQSKDRYFVWHDLSLPFHSKEFNPKKKLSAQIDFLVICSRGILVLEVKGGSISTKDGMFYYGKNFDKEMAQNPFHQAEGCKHTLRQGILSSFSHVLFCHAVVFPDVNMQFTISSVNDSYLWTRYKSETYYKNSFEKFIKSVFDELEGRHRERGWTFPYLVMREIGSIKNILSPTIFDKNSIPQSSTADWLRISNLNILDALSQNKRIMIEGPPGSGKTTIAKGYIDKRKGKKGLYLCWNNLLMAFIKEVLNQRGLDEWVEVTTLTSLLMNIEPSIKYEDIKALYSDDEFVKLIYRAMMKEELKQYDYIVIDEAQDVFTKGIEAVIDRLCGYNHKGLLEGESLILYDIEQAHRSGYSEALEVSKIISENYAHFKLVSIQRQIQAPQILKFSESIWDEDFVLDKSLSNERVKITFHDEFREIKKKLVSEYTLNFKDSSSSLNVKDCILLIGSSIYKYISPNLDDLVTLITGPGFEELTTSNILNNNENLKYTSIIKFKGLEKPIVILVVDRLNRYNQYELFIGATRAIDFLRIFVHDRN